MGVIAQAEFFLETNMATPFRILVCHIRNLVPKKDVMVITLRRENGGTTQTETSHRNEILILQIMVDLKIIRIHINTIGYQTLREEHPNTARLNRWRGHDKNFSIPSISARRQSCSIN